LEESKLKAERERERNGSKKEEGRRKLIIK
jgi:hypothetical protein